MSEQEMKDIWLNADDAYRISFDLPQLLINLKGRMKSLDRALFYRDAREIGAAVLIILFFGYKIFAESSTLLKIINVLYIIWGAYVIYRLMDVRKYKKMTELGASLKQQLRQQKMYLQEQAYLLDSVLFWYIAPPAVLGMMTIVGKSYFGSFEWGDILLSLIIIIGISWGIYLLNKKASKTTYRPLIEKIDTVLIQLDEDHI